MRALVILLFVTVLFFPCIIFAYTETEYQDVVYLKNGSVVHGTIIEQIPNVSVKIKTETGDIWVFSYDEIEKITKEETGGVVIPEMQTWKYPEIPGTINRKGLLNYAKINFISYRGKEGGISSFGYVGGEGLGHVFIGGGTELGFGEEWPEKGTFLPIYGETKFYFMPKSHFTPTAYADAGVQIAACDVEVYHLGRTETKLVIGFLVGGGGGIEYRVSPHLGFDFNVGYRGFSMVGDWYNHIIYTFGITF